MRAATVAFTLLIAQAAHAGPPEFVLPLDCVLGRTCYIEDYVDADPGPGQMDYTCGLKSRDGHNGTDFMLESFDAMKAGVHVLAAASGIVAATRDSMPDQAVNEALIETVAGRECGNAVRIDHGGGWQTLYCHMREGSVLVRQGDAVDTGTPLGLVGLSGLTNVPHLHMTVLRDGEVIDPFSPGHTHECPPPDGDTLWLETPHYHSAGLFTAGFSTSVPSLEDVQSGAARTTGASAYDSLVLYGYVFHADEGDVLEFRAIGPTGEIFAHREILKDPQVQLFRAFGRKPPASGWPDGAYRGVVRLLRGDELIAWRHADIDVPRP